MVCFYESEHVHSNPMPVLISKEVKTIEQKWQERKNEIGSLNEAATKA